MVDGRVRVSWSGNNLAEPILLQVYNGFEFEVFLLIDAFLHKELKDGPTIYISVV